MAEATPASRSGVTRKRARPKELDEPTKWNVSVDPTCIERVDVAHVLCKDDVVWDANLNLTNYTRSNNKFFKLQLLKMNDRRSYSVWSRGGRIGNVGRGTLVKFGPYINKAKEHFKLKFYEKTHNLWDERSTFKRVKGCHDLMDVNLSKTEIPEVQEDNKALITLPQEIDDEIMELMKFIYGISKEHSYQTLGNSSIYVWTEDSGLLPSEKQITCALEILKKMRQFLQCGFNKELVELSDEFYTKIPHNFGPWKPPNILTKETVLEKIMQLEVLRAKLQSPKTPWSQIRLPINCVVNKHYEFLDCKITSMQEDSEMFQMISKYLLNSHGETHHYTMKVSNIFECVKESEETKFKDLGNRMLLWHGSPKYNFSGILGEGLKLPSVLVSNRLLMFGRGVYFADRSSKSANYCAPNNHKYKGLLMLCEVSLGKCEVLFEAKSTADAPSPGNDSIKGEGTWIPDPTEQVTLSDGTIVPMGKCMVNTTLPTTCPLYYNEYVVYSADQIKMRYLVKVDFQCLV